MTEPLVPTLVTRRPGRGRRRASSTPRVEGGDRHARGTPVPGRGRRRASRAATGTPEAARSGPEGGRGSGTLVYYKLEARRSASAREARRSASAREARRSAAASAASAPRRARWGAPGSRRGRRVGPLPLRRRDGRVGVGPLPLQRARRSALRADGRPGVGARARVAHLLEDVLHRAPRSLRVDVLGQEPVHLGDRRRRRLAPARPRGAGPARLGSGIRASAPSRAGPACPE
jgi:hypothetical protein